MNFTIFRMCSFRPSIYILHKLNQLIKEHIMHNARTRNQSIANENRFRPLCDSNSNNNKNRFLILINFPLYRTSQIYICINKHKWIHHPFGFTLFRHCFLPVFNCLFPFRAVKSHQMLRIAVWLIFVLVPLMKWTKSNELKYLYAPRYENSSEFFCVRCTESLCFSEFGICFINFNSTGTVNETKHISEMWLIYVLFTFTFNSFRFSFLSIVNQWIVLEQQKTIVFPFFRNTKPKIIDIKSNNNNCWNADFSANLLSYHYCKFIGQNSTTRTSKWTAWYLLVLQ